MERGMLPASQLDGAAHAALPIGVQSHAHRVDAGTDHTGGSEPKLAASATVAAGAALQAPKR